jgi:pyridoxal phosphate enzyme (YggS family)
MIPPRRDNNTRSEEASAETAAFSIREHVANNLARVRDRMRQAAERSGRPLKEIRLVAATKYASTEECQALLDAGQRILAESRLPECLDKMEALAPARPEWHFIGHLQRNKAKLVAGRFALIHSLDSVRLMETLADLARERGGPIRGLLEFNVAGESQKQGFAPSAWREALDAARRLAPHVVVEGLMGMAPYTDDPQFARPSFIRLRDLRDQLREASGGELPLPELSMGMSGDFEVAIEEGATLARVGSALFEK